ncbi:SAM-dependent methyltransferase [Pseudonocardia acaciae]|uniref:SAM-dependent methyltransferase n=1 Tax=Pseudonocardia acaciae TaxID=551276 RepID=UPI00048C975C|nr:SAM-dependent methyltransferase [Pseudonocardia acaciae]
MADAESGGRAAEIDFNRPNSARIWNYLGGGKNYYEADKTAGDAFSAAFPGIVTFAVQSREFVIRSVRYLAAEAGIRQFLDIGTGFPATENTHEVAQAVAPDARIVYVDNDPVVLAHAQALLTNTTDEGVTAFVDSDLRNTERVISAAHATLNFTQPIGVMFMGSLGQLEDYDEVLAIVRRYMGAVPSGSYLAHYEGEDTDADYQKALAAFNAIASEGSHYYARTREQMEQMFEGLELVEPGVVKLDEWRPEGGAEKLDVVSLCGVGRKP